MKQQKLKEKETKLKQEFNKVIIFKIWVLIKQRKYVTTLVLRGWAWSWIRYFLHASWAISDMVKKEINPQKLFRLSFFVSKGNKKLIFSSVDGVRLRGFKIFRTQDSLREQKGICSTMTAWLLVVAYLSYTCSSCRFSWSKS